MTRETKIGLVIGCSFLCLVGVVVASKWRGSEDPSETQEPPLAGQSSVAVAQVKDNGKKDDKPSVAPVAKASAPEKKKDAQHWDLKPLDLPPVNMGVNGMTEDEKIKAQIRNANASTPMPQPVSGLGPVQFNDVKPAGNNLNANFPGPQPADRKENFIPPPSALDIQVKPAQQKDVQPLPPPFAFGTDQGVGPKPFSGLDDKTPVSPPFVPMDNGGRVEMPPVKPLDMPPQFPPAGKEAGLPMFPPQEKNVVKPPEMPSFPPQNNVVKPTELPPFPPQKDTVKPADLPPFGPQNKDVTPSVPPFGPIDKGNSPSAPREVPTIPPFNTNAITPPINIGGNQRPLPVVRDSNVRVDEVRAGETSFAALSQRLYGTDRLADKLQSYNRTHSVAIKNGANLASSSPILTPGQQVLVPSRDDLERDFTPTISVPMNPAPAVKLTLPSPLTPVGGVANPPAPSIGGGRTYVVQNPNGESILNIAERTLGNRDRWTEIYRINQANPNVRSQSLHSIPAGTELKMPAN